jgi:hypothetical protein
MAEDAEEMKRREGDARERGCVERKSGGNSRTGRKY